MPNTTNFNWPTPADTDLVKDGAAAIRNLGDGVDTSLVDLKGGTTGQVLSKTSNTDMDFTWVAQDDTDAIQSSIIAAKGDLIVGTANDTAGILSVGTDGYTLVADSSTATGLAYAAPAASSGPTFRAFRDTSVQSLTINTATKIAFNAETWDSDNCFDSTTNYRFTADKAGYYQFNTSISFSTGGAIGRNFMRFYKNGSEFIRLVDGPAPQQYGQMIGSALIYLNGTTDYVEVYAQLGTATTREIDPGTALTAFDGVWIRS